jgi:DNA-binding transcriptional regulator YhcF (GntR family)
VPGPSAGRAAPSSRGVGRHPCGRSGSPSVSPALTVTPDDPTPPSEQLRRQLVDLIEGGQLVEGERLPPLRQLAGDSQDVPRTRGGRLVRSRRGGGTRVASAAPKPSAREREVRLARLAAAYVTKAWALGATDAEIAAAVRNQSI